MQCEAVSETIQVESWEEQQGIDEEMQANYVEQQRRLCCPACGEAEEVF